MLIFFPVQDLFKKTVYRLVKQEPGDFFIEIGVFSLKNFNCSLVENLFVH